MLDAIKCKQLGVVILHAGEKPDGQALGCAQKNGTVSLISEAGASDSFISAHEFGHNLTLDHDGHGQGSLMDKTGSGSCLSLDDVIAARANAELKASRK